MKARRYPSSIPFISWERPTDAQQKEGILAIMIERCHLYHDGRVIPYEQRTPYRHDSLLRRYKRGADMPPFLTVANAALKEQDNESNNMF